jgi:hypothetical protein
VPAPRKCCRRFQVAQPGFRLPPERIRDRDWDYLTRGVQASNVSVRLLKRHPSEWRFQYGVADIDSPGSRAGAEDQVIASATFSCAQLYFNIFLIGGRASGLYSQRKSIQRGTTSVSVDITGSFPGMQFDSTSVISGIPKDTGIYITSAQVIDAARRAAETIA